MEMQLSTVIGLALILVAFILYKPVTGIISDSVNENIEKTLCKTTVGTSLNAFDARIWSPFELFCPRTLIVIEQEDMKRTYYEFLTEKGGYGEYYYMTMEQKDDGLKPVTHSKTPEENELKESFEDILSYEAAECWNTFLEGRIDILSSDTLFKAENTCLICSEIIINRNDASGSINLTDHMRGEAVPITTEKQTYNNYLYNERYPSYSQRCKEYWYDQGNIELDRDESYMVAFYRHAAWIKTVDQRLPTANDGLFTCQGVGIVPAKNFSDYCQVVVN